MRAKRLRPTFSNIGIGEFAGIVVRLKDIIQNLRVGRTLTSLKALTSTTVANVGVWRIVAGCANS